MNYDNPDIRLLRIGKGKKKVWVLADIKFNDIGEPVDFEMITPPAQFDDIEDAFEFKEVLSGCLFYSSRYEIYRGKIRRSKR